MKMKIIKPTVFLTVLMLTLCVAGQEKKTPVDVSKAFIKAENLTWEPAGENVRRQVMGWNEKCMMVKVEFLKSGAVGAVHSHPHIQNSYVASGKFEVMIGEHKRILQGGDGYFIESDIPHGVVCLEPGVLIDAFTPYRADFVSKP